MMHHYSNYGTGNSSSDDEVSQYTGYLNKEGVSKAYSNRLTQMITPTNKGTTNNKWAVSSASNRPVYKRCNSEDTGYNSFRSHNGDKFMVEEEEDGDVTIHSQSEYSNIMINHSHYRDVLSPGGEGDIGEGDVGDIPRGNQHYADYNGSNQDTGYNSSTQDPGYNCSEEGDENSTSNENEGTNNEDENSLDSEDNVGQISLQQLYINRQKAAERRADANTSGSRRYENSKRRNVRHPAYTNNNNNNVMKGFGGNLTIFNPTKSLSHCRSITSPMTTSLNARSASMTNLRGEQASPIQEDSNPEPATTTPTPTTPMSKWAQAALSNDATYGDYSPTCATNNTPTPTLGGSSKASTGASTAAGPSVKPQYVKVEGQGMLISQYQSMQNLSSPSSSLGGRQTPSSDRYSSMSGRYTPSTDRYTPLSGRYTPSGPPDESGYLPGHSQYSPKSANAVRKKPKILRRKQSSDNMSSPLSNTFGKFKPQYSSTPSLNKLPLSTPFGGSALPNRQTIDTQQQYAQQPQQNSQYSQQPTQYSQQSPRHSQTSAQYSQQPPPSPKQHSQQPAHYTQPQHSPSPSQHTQPQHSQQSPQHTQHSPQYLQHQQMQQQQQIHHQHLQEQQMRQQEQLKQQQEQLRQQEQQRQHLEQQKLQEQMRQQQHRLSSGGQTQHGQNKLDEALVSSGRISDALASLLEWLNKAETYLAEDQPILGDLDTVNILIEQHRAFQTELESRREMVQNMRDNESPETDTAVASQLEELGHVWDRVNTLSQIRESRLSDAVKLAEEFNEAVQTVRDWLPHVEAELKFKPLPDDELSIIQLMEAHEAFEEELRGQQPNIEKIRYLAEEILQSCHPNAVRFVRYYLTITHTRWEQALSRAEQRGQRLHEALQGVRGNAQLVEELLAWLTEAQALLTTKERDPIPEDITVVDALVKEHLEFHEDLNERSKHVEKVASLGGSNKDTKKALHGSNYDLSKEDRPSPRVATLQNKWRAVWRMSVDRKKKLQDVLDHLLELESFKNFDFEVWRQRYVAWIRAKKFRITDFFRKQDRDGDGVLNRTEFVDGMINSQFPTNRTELNAVFDVFDKHGTGELDYKEFMAALKPDRQASRRMSAANTPMSDAQAIHDEIEHQVSHCQCRSQFKVKKMAEGKYRMGEKGKMCLVRFLNSTVMVRVGGGWQRLDEFLETNDPCRAKGRTNMDLRETLSAGDASTHSPGPAHSGRALFTPKSHARRSSTPNHHTNGKHNLSSNSSSPTALNPKLSSSTASLSSSSGVGGSGRRTPSGGKGGLASRSMQNLASQSLSSFSSSRRSSINSQGGRVFPLAPHSGSSSPATPTTPTEGAKKFPKMIPSLGNLSRLDNGTTSSNPTRSPTKRNSSSSIESSAKTPTSARSKSGSGSSTSLSTRSSNTKHTTTGLSRNKSNTSDASLKSNPEDVFTFDKPDSFDSPPPFDLPDNAATPGSPDRAGKPRVPPFKGFSFGGDEGLKSPPGSAGGTKMGKKAESNQRFALRSSLSNLSTGGTPSRSGGSAAFGSSTPARPGGRKPEERSMNGRTPTNGRTTPSGRTTPGGDRAGARTPAGARGATPRSQRTGSGLTNKPMRFT